MDFISDLVFYLWIGLLGFITLFLSYCILKAVARISLMIAQYFFKKVFGMTDAQRLRFGFVTLEYTNFFIRFVLIAVAAWFLGNGISAVLFS